DKHTTVIIRTNKGKEVFKKAVNAGIITSREMDEIKKKKMLESIIEYSKSKVSRKEKFMQKIT
ncbi:MAG: Coenzyme F420 hydrogenase/dehydrogenase, beta subunit C-terminal domain, partial [Promethearchaeota archaeon]